MPSTPAPSSTPTPIPFPEARARRRPGSAAEIHCGRELAPGERVLWEGGPSTGGLALKVFRWPLVAAWFGAVIGYGLVGVGFGRATLADALAPAIPGLLTLALVFGLARLVARSTRYVVTPRRVILRYGVGLPRSLSIPLSQIASLAVAPGRGGRGDVALAPREPGALAYLKLWPYARPWRWRRPEPTLRDVPQAGLVATRLAQALAQAERERLAKAAPTETLAATA